jgi:ribosomal protein L11 methyltransferase
MSEPKWLEVSLIVDGEMAESVAEVLARFIPNGIVIESTAVNTDSPDSPGHAIGPLRVSGYIHMDSQLEATRQRLEEALWYLGRIRPLPVPVFQPIHDINWIEAWKDHFHPIAIGKKLIIIPAWLEPETAGLIPIRIDPGMAFGTGTHPTTQLCLELIETIQMSVPDPGITEVIDIGCGSGILSIAAIKLGVRCALGLDIDPEAIEAARENARLNRVTEQLELGVGSLTEIQDGKYSTHKSSLVLANILAPVIVRLLNQGLGDLLTPGGYLVLSGILEEQSKEVESAMQKNGLSLVERRQQGDWVALWARSRLLP